MNTQHIDVAHPDPEVPAGTPSADELISTIADKFGVDCETACQWLLHRQGDMEAWIPQ